MRKKTNRRLDVKMFKRALNHTKMINIRPVLMRGGFRL